ncbi:hypothetical protein HMI54_009061, partial [Coelomomyces lativittatus]
MVDGSLCTLDLLLDLDLSRISPSSPSFPISPTPFILSATNTKTPFPSPGTYFAAKSNELGDLDAQFLTTSSSSTTKTTNSVSSSPLPLKKNPLTNISSTTLFPHSTTTPTPPLPLNFVPSLSTPVSSTENTMPPTTSTTSFISTATYNPTSHVPNEIKTQKDCFTHIPQFTNTSNSLSSPLSPPPLPQPLISLSTSQLLLLPMTNYQTTFSFTNITSSTWFTYEILWPASRFHVTPDQGPLPPHHTATCTLTFTNTLHHFHLHPHQPTLLHAPQPSTQLHLLLHPHLPDLLDENENENDEFKRTSMATPTTPSFTSNPSSWTCITYVVPIVSVTPTIHVTIT